MTHSNNGAARLVDAFGFQLILTTLGREYDPPTGDYWNDNWRVADMTAEIEAFHFHLSRTTLFAPDLKYLRRRLAKIVDKATGAMDFSPMGQQFRLRLRVEDHEILGRVDLFDPSRRPQARLSIRELSFDVDSIADFARDLRMIDRAYPVVGNRRVPRDDV